MPQAFHETPSGPALGIIVAGVAGVLGAMLGTMMSGTEAVMSAGSLFEMSGCTKDGSGWQSGTPGMRIHPGAHGSMAVGIALGVAEAVPGGGGV